ncbi:probable protein phosphatase 2C 42 [Oryza brachyantha]|uniref:probable protein phosphatase 2C 42 n=1 Tax=Oryza brachyantha TaxID=4533 RepID=UPI0003EAB55D|nr:probable protein phosphatase 2C 42 [Oryza brachyantha]XP_015695318.1 probable protein phosphatase 2C 42 [Oryza brachyantha]XP_015695321.1 probable protein phosphatase 2C 42 [Oryza brachyantha]
MALHRVVQLPEVSKTTYTGGNARLVYASSSMQGYRSTMEDALIAFESLNDLNETSFFGVYDGHGGCAVAKYCANNLHIRFLQEEDFHVNLPNALRKAFLRVDEMLQNKASRRELSGYGSGSRVYKASCFGCTPCLPGLCYRGPLKEGCTACVVVIRNNQIIVGNAGDSRCVLSRNGQAIALSRDHRLVSTAEYIRIVAAGGNVAIADGLYYVSNGIGVSRAIGYFSLKQNKMLPNEEQALICMPEINSEQITLDTEFLVIASDGIWDALSNQAVVDFVNIRLKHGVDPFVICESLLNVAVTHEPPALDNLSVILVKFLHPDAAGASGRRSADI